MPTATALQAMARANFNLRIRKIVGELSPTGTSLSTNLSGCARNSDKKGRQFLDADWASAAAMGSQFNNLSWMIPLGVFSPSSILIPFTSILESIYKKGIDIWTSINPPPVTLPPQPIPQKNLTRTVLSQKNLDEDNPKDVLDVVRWETNEKKVESNITDVRGHIQAFGCLLTCYAMVLRDKGVEVNVTDLYKTNYYLKNKKKSTFDEDVKNSNDNHIVLFDLQADPNVVNEFDKKYQEILGNFSINTDSEKERGLTNAIEENGGTIIINVNKPNPKADGHWVVINKLEDGTYIVRDPLKGELTYKTFEDFKADYVLSGRYKYIKTV